MSQAVEIGESAFRVSVFEEVAGFALPALLRVGGIGNPNRPGRRQVVPHHYGRATVDPARPLGNRKQDFAPPRPTFGKPMPKPVHDIGMQDLLVLTAVFAVCCRHGHGGRIYDVSTGQGTSLPSLPGKYVQHRSLTFSPDGRRLAATGGFNTTHILDVEMGQIVFPFLGHTGRVYAVALSPDGKRLASAGQDGAVKIWDGATGQEILTLRDHQGAHHCLAWSPNGERLASASEHGTIRVWNASRGYALATSPTFPIERTCSRARRLMEQGQCQKAVAILQKLGGDAPKERDYLPIRGRSYPYAANLRAPLSAPRFLCSSYLLSGQTDTKTVPQPSEPRVRGSSPLGRAAVRALAHRRKRPSLLGLRCPTPNTSKPSDDRVPPQLATI